MRSGQPPEMFSGATLSLMSRIGRASVALVLVLAFGAVPLAIDWCAASCEAVQLVTPGDAPPCHHAASTSARMDRLPAPCGHDHHAVVIVVSSNPPVASRTAISVPAPAIAGQVATFHFVAMSSRAGPDIGSSRRSISLALSSLLRI